MCWASSGDKPAITFLCSIYQIHCSQVNMFRVSEFERIWQEAPPASCLSLSLTVFSSLSLMTGLLTVCSSPRTDLNCAEDVTSSQLSAQSPQPPALPGWLPIICPIMPGEVALTGDSGRPGGPSNTRPGSPPASPALGLSTNRRPPSLGPTNHRPRPAPAGEQEGEWLQVREIKYCGSFYQEIK